MGTWIAWVGLVQNLVFATFVVLLLRRRVRRIDLWMVVLAFGTFNLVSNVYLVPALVGSRVPGWADLVFQSARIVIATLFLGFAGLHPSWSFNRRKAWFLIWAAIPGAFLLGLFALTPQTAIEGSGSTALFTNMVNVVLSASILIALSVLAIKWMRSPADTYRRQYLYLIVPFLIFAVNDSMGSFDFTESAVHAGEGVPSLIVGISVLRLMVVAVLLVHTLLQLRITGRSWRSDDRTLLAWILASIPLGALQFFPGPLSSTTILLHIVVDQVGSVVLAYGAARFQVLDVDLKLKVGIKASTLAALFIAVFFVTVNVAQAFLTDALGWAVGGVIAGLLFFFLAPLQQIAERISSAALPGVSNTTEYRDDRKVTIYRIQLEEMLSDGTVSPKERRALFRLQESLALDPRTANHIETQTMTRLRLV